MRDSPQMQSPAKVATKARAISKVVEQHNDSIDNIRKPQAIDVFGARCEARALLWFEWLIDLHSAVDELQLSAVQTGLVARYGQDAIQERMGAAFAAWRRA